MSRRYALLKRALDVVGASVGLALSAPVLAALAVVVRASIGGPAIFRQVRAGEGGAPFVIYKLRTMRDAVDAGGRVLPDHERLTRFGAFLRSTSLDELPQFWNVLRGDMSLVGPRPLYPEYIPRYSPEQARRLEVKPGITGWAAVNGRNGLEWDTQLRLDTWYVDNRSTLLDLRILGRTVMQVVRRDGITQAGHVTRDPFPGARS